MIEQVKTAYRYLLVMGSGAVLLLLSVMVPVVSSSADFSIYNTGWNGCSQLGRDTYSSGSFLPTVDIHASTEEVIAHSSFADMDDVLEPESSVIIIIGPDVPFTGREGRFAHTFLTEGGTILLADDVGEGNDLLGKLNTTTRISGELMVDLSFMKGPEFSVATDFRGHPVTNDLTMLLMNYPSTVSPSPGAVSIMNSSNASWLDADGDRKKGPEEEGGPFPLLTLESYGNGRLIVLSEPSLLINQMRSRMDNSRFVSNLLDYLSTGINKIVIDESHHDLTNPVYIMNRYVGTFDPVEKAGFLFIFILLFLVWELRFHRRAVGLIRNITSRFSRDGVTARSDPNDLLEKVMERHPDWDREVLVRMIRDIEGER